MYHQTANIKAHSGEEYIGQMWKNHETSKPIHFLIAAVICAAGVLYFGRIDYTDGLFFDWDLWSYRYIAGMAPEIGSNIEQPFAFRLLGPYLAGILSGHTDWGFYSITIICSFVFAVTFYGFQVYMGIKPSIALFVLVVFICNKYIFGYTVWNYFNINDMLSLIYLAIMIWALVASRWWLFGLVLLIGVLTKETALIMVPVAGVYLLETRSNTQQWKLAVVAILPGAACFFLMRIIVPHSGGDGLLEAFLNNSSKLLSLEVWYRLFINSFAPISLLPLVFFNETKRFFRDHNYLLVLIVVVFVTTLFGSNNERLMGPSSLAYYLLFASIVQNSFNANKWMLVLVASCAVLNSSHHNIGAFTLANRDITIFLSVTSIFVVTLSAIAFRTFGHKRCFIRHS